MSTARKCDRCGKYYERGLYHNTLTVKVNGRRCRGSEISFSCLVPTGDKIGDEKMYFNRQETVDLCPDCLREFYTWFVGGQPEPHSVPGVCESTFD